MFSIIEHIEYLITRHDCVIIPGWGGFIANYNPASYDESRMVMVHPSRAIGFNANITHNDGLLVQSLMRREGLSYDEALRFIADSVATFVQQLSMDGEVSMGRLGFFRRFQSRYIEFVPFSRAITSDQYFGLADMELKTVDVLESERIEQENQTSADDIAAIVPKERSLFPRKATQIAASIAVLLGLSILLSTPITVDRSHDLASMAPTVTAPRAQQLSTSVQQDVVPQEVQVVEAYPAIARVGNTSGKYYMVIATLRNQHELDAFKNANADLVPYMKILDYKGLMCVYVARSNDYGTLMSLRDTLPQGLRDVWIYN